MVRLGLCCMFHDQPIRFRTTTATALAKLGRDGARVKLAGLVRENVAALRDSVLWCAAHGIGAFRVNSQILPVCTHPEQGYALPELPGGEALVSAFREAGEVARRKGVRLSFHPDQFVVLSTPRPEVLAASLAELEAQSEVAEWIGADVVNIHGGGAYGDPEAALARFVTAVEQLSPRARARLTVENDDKVYSPAQLLPLCEATGIPLCYDAHHHRCLQDALSVEAASERAMATWGGREPLFHLSSPLEGWTGPKPARHHDFIDAADFPACWQSLEITVDVEAKAKELAVLRLREHLVATGVAVR